jgi:hypothetical protein
MCFVLWVEIQLESRGKSRHWAHCILLAQVSSKLHKRESNDAAGRRRSRAKRVLFPLCLVLIHNYGDATSTAPFYYFAFYGVKLLVPTTH